MQRDVYFLCFKFSLLVVFVVSLFCFGVRISVSPRLALNTRSSLEACFTTPSFPFTYLKKFSSQAIKIMRAVEIAQQLKTHTVAEGPSLVLSTHIQQLRTICNSSSRDPPTWWAPEHSNMQIQTPTHSQARCRTPGRQRQVDLL